MKKLLFVITIVIGILASGCSTTTGVIPAGKDTFTIIQAGFGIFTSVGTLKAAAYKRANKYCHERGLIMQPISTETTPFKPFCDPSFELTFRALPPDDPEVSRPLLKKSADISVEVLNN